LSMKETHQGKFRFHIPLLILLLIFALTSFSQQRSPDTAVFVPSIDSLPAEIDSVATAVPIDREASADANDEDEDEGVKDDEKEKNKFIEIASPGWKLDSFPQRRADTRLFKNDDDFWYANATFAKKKQENKDSKSSTFYQTLLWLLAVGGFIAFLIIYLGNINISLFHRSKTMEQVEGEYGTEDIFAINYNKEIEKAIAAGDYRLAVRLLFLQLLRGMSDRKIIQYSHERTNLDYLLQVHHASWYQQFFRITRNYEYVWYGLFEIDKNKFEAINKDVKSLEHQLPTI
jgi:hypothetical protein